MKLSKFDNFLLDLLRKDQVVYAGGSAGAMVAAKTLKFYGHDEASPSQVKTFYGVEPEMAGLGLIDGFIVPHIGNEEYCHVTDLYLSRLQQAGQKIIALSDTDVMVVNGKISSCLHA